MASIKGVLLSRAPHANIVDITHEIPPQDVTTGAFTLAAARPWFPDGTVFMAVVDPGVGTSRPLIAIRADRHYLVGPDNGLLALSAAQSHTLTIVKLTNRRYRLTSTSRTFHGRDILAPVAAHLATGGALSPLGEPVRRMVPLPFPPVTRRGRATMGRIVHIDVFGNLVTNIPLSVASPLHSTFQCRYRHRKLRVVSSYADGRPRELIALAGSLNLLELAIAGGSAARLYHVRRGERVELIA